MLGDGQLEMEISDPSSEQADFSINPTRLVWVSFVVQAIEITRFMARIYERSRWVNRIEQNIFHYTFTWNALRDW